MELSMNDRFLNAVKSNDLLRVNELLQQSSSNPIDIVNSCDNDQSTALHWSCWLKNISITTLLIQYSADINAINIRGESVLEWSLRSKSNPIVLLLLNQSTLNIHSANKAGGTAIHIAAEESYLESLISLYLLGGNLNAVDNRFKSPLHCAIHRNQLTAVIWLLRHGASIDSIDSDGATVLHYAAITGSIQLTAELIRNGGGKYLFYKTNSTATNNTISNNTPFNDRLLPEELALKCGHNGLNQFLISNRLRLNSIQRFFTPAHLQSNPFNKPRPLATGPQIYFYCAITIILIHFYYYIQPILYSIDNTIVLQPLLSIFWFSCLFGIIGMGGFQYTNPGYALHNNSDSMQYWLIQQVMNNIPVCACCRTVKPIRSKHCNECNQCVLRMDHHCPWVNNCVGQNNHRYFISVILIMFTVAVIHIYYLTAYLYYTIYTVNSTIASSYYIEKWSIIFLIHSILIILGCLGLLGGQLYTISIGFTTNEAFNRYRYQYIQNNSGLSPFTDGSTIMNLLVFIGLKSGKSFIRDKINNLNINNNPNRILTIDDNQSIVNEYLAAINAPPTAAAIKLQQQRELKSIENNNSHSHSLSSGSNCNHNHSSPIQNQNNNLVNNNINSNPSTVASAAAPNSSIIDINPIDPDHIQIHSNNQQQHQQQQPIDIDPHCSYLGSMNKSTAAATDSIPSNKDH